MKHYKKLWIAVVVGSGIGLAQAQDSSPNASIYRLSGFGTLGISHSDNVQADFSSTVFHPNGAGYTRSWSADVDTKVGMQVNANFTQNLSGVVQVISQQGYNNAYTPTLEWANISYKITPDLTLRAGRTVWPLLLRSETQNIGYGNPFVRNSTELLANMPNTFSDGVDISYQFPIGPAANSVQLLVGKSDVNYPGQWTDGSQNYLHVKDIKGISDVLEYGDLKVHVAFMDLKYDWLYFGYLLNDVPYKTWSVGFNYDPGKWFVTADLLKVQDQSYGNFTATTAGAGYRIGDWAPYVLYSTLTQDSLGDLPSFGTYPGDKQTVSAVGVRWDFKKNADLKIQYEQIKSGAISQIFPSSLTNWQSNFLNDPNANVLSIVVDFVF
jgi:hypothetical protein